jgi:hypothetical protein
MTREKHFKKLKKSKIHAQFLQAEAPCNNDNKICVQ